MQQTKNRLIINRFRLFSRRLFKFRRKKSFNQMNFNNNHNQESSKITIQQILNRQWIQAFEHRKSERRISLIKTNTEQSSCCSLSLSNENDSYPTDGVDLFHQSYKHNSRTRILNHFSTIYRLNPIIRPLK